MLLLVFNCRFYDTDISLNSVATHLRCGEIFSDSVAADFFPDSESEGILNISLHLMKLLAYKNIVPVFWTTV